ncbi:hypothetical protein OROGR_002512 [Orobanche gracilis]
MFGVPYDTDDDAIRGRDGSMKSSDCPVGDSLSDLLIHIFCKLPLKSVVACYDTCPRWKRIIGSSLFSEAFLQSAMVLSQAERTNEGFKSRHLIYEIEDADSPLLHFKQPLVFSSSRC